MTRKAGRLQEQHNVHHMFALIRKEDADGLDKFLTENPAMAKMKDGAGRPPLTVVTTLAVVEVLRKHDADPNATNAVGIAAISAWLMERKRQNITASRDPVLESLIDAGGVVSREKDPLPAGGSLFRRPDDQPAPTKKRVRAPIDLAAQNRDTGALELFYRKRPQAFSDMLSIPPATETRTHAAKKARAEPAPALE